MRGQIPFLTKNPEEILCLNRLADLIERTMEKSYLNHSTFLSPKEQFLASKLLLEKGLPEYFFWGGHEDAERKILVVLPSYLTKEEVLEEWHEEGKKDPLMYLRLHHEGERTLRHGDYLGSILALGLDRKILGDIFVREDGADIILLREMEEFIRLNLTKVGREGIRIEPLNVSKNLICPLREYKTESYALASLRLDAYVSEIFRLSRESAKSAIASGLVSVNGSEEMKKHRFLEEGDTVSFRGKGKSRLEKIGGESKKGRIWIEILRY